MPGEPGYDGIHHRQTLAALPPAPSTFGTTVLPCYRELQVIPSGGHERWRALGRELAINIQCPRDTVDDYLGLLCREAGLLRARLPEPLPVASLWLRGSPSRQFSPEAVTELIFRLNTQFPLSSATAVRGLELPAPAVNPERLALLSGLGFNRIALRIDATLGSDERSLARLHAMQRQLTDFATLGVHYQVRFGSRSHPRYLSRLLAAMRRPPVTAIELCDPDQETPRPLAERIESGRLFELAVTEMMAAGWVAFGNQFFVPADSPLAPPEIRQTLHFTPWGPQPEAGRLSLGMGIGAFGYQHPCYYRTTTSETGYRDALHHRQLPEKTLYCLGDDRARAHHLVQTLLCGHRLPLTAVPGLRDTLTAEGLLTACGASGHLTGAGIVRLSAILHDLQSQSCWGEDHAQSRFDDRHGA